MTFLQVQVPVLMQASPRAVTLQMNQRSLEMNQHVNRMDVSVIRFVMVLETAVLTYKLSIAFFVSCT